MRCTHVFCQTTLEVGKDTCIKRAITGSGKRLGYDKIKPMQIEALTSFLQGNDVFVYLPTAYGKSIIYAALPYSFDNLRSKLKVCVI